MARQAKEVVVCDFCSKDDKLEIWNCNYAHMKHILCQNNAKYRIGTIFYVSGAILAVFCSP